MQYLRQESEKKACTLLWKENANQLLEFLQHILFVLPLLMSVEFLYNYLPCNTVQFMPQIKARKQHINHLLYMEHVIISEML